MAHDHEPSIELRLTGLVEQLTRLEKDARRLTSHRKSLSALTAETIHENHSDHLEYQSRGRQLLRYEIGRCINEIGNLLEDWEECESIDWRQIISLKRERDALVLRERPLSQIESAWDEDRILAIKDLLAKIQGAMEGNLGESNAAASQFVKESIIPLPTPAGTQWSDVSIHFLNDEYISIMIRRERHQCDYRRAGFGKQNSAKWVSAWAMLTALANCSGEIKRPVELPQISQVEKSI